LIVENTITKQKTACYIAAQISGLFIDILVSFTIGLHSCKLKINAPYLRVISVLIICHIPFQPRLTDSLISPATPQKTNNLKLHKGLYITGRRRGIPYNKGFFSL
jgi:hypothetical protein